MTITKKQLTLIITIIFFVVAYFFSVDEPSTPEITNNNLAPIASTTTPESTSSLELPEPAIAGEKITNFSETDYYSVTKIIDGDTFEVNLAGKLEKLRLIGINTPETVDPRRKVECFGKEASAYAKKLLSGQKVKLASDTSQTVRDKYGRLLVYAWLPDGTFFNLKMIAEGYAYEYTYQTPYFYQTDFRQAQADAKANELGLWSPTTCNGKK